MRILFKIKEEQLVLEKPTPNFPGDNKAPLILRPRAHILVTPEWVSGSDGPAQVKSLVVKGRLGTVTFYLDAEWNEEVSEGHYTVPAGTHASFEGSFEVFRGRNIVGYELPETSKLEIIHITDAFGIVDSLEVYMDRRKLFQPLLDNVRALLAENIDGCNDKKIARVVAILEMTAEYAGHGTDAKFIYDALGPEDWGC